MFVDSHCHLNLLKLTEFEGSGSGSTIDIPTVLKLAQEAKVEHLLTVSVKLQDYPELLALCKAYPQLSMSMGVHPCEELKVEPTYDELMKLGSVEPVVAIGETGLDYHWCKGDVAWQQDRFRTHIQVAKALSKPLIIHTREAQIDTIDIMRSEKANDCQGVMHCFTEDWDMAKKALDLGFYISFSGIVTFKNATILQDVAMKIPLDRMLIETDSPYLAPVPKRGKANFPHYVPYVAEFIAKLRNTEVENIAKITTQNFYQLFKIEPKTNLA